MRPEQRRRSSGWVVLGAGVAIVIFTFFPWVQRREGGDLALIDRSGITVSAFGWIVVALGIAIALIGVALLRSRVSVSLLGWLLLFLGFGVGALVLTSFADMSSVTLTESIGFVAVAAVVTVMNAFLLLVPPRNAPQRPNAPCRLQRPDPPCRLHRREPPLAFAQVADGRHVGARSRAVRLHGRAMRAIYLAAALVLFIFGFIGLASIGWLLIAAGLVMLGLAFFTGRRR